MTKFIRQETIAIDTRSKLVVEQSAHSNYRIFVITRYDNCIELDKDTSAIRIMAVFEFLKRNFQLWQDIRAS